MKTALVIMAAGIGSRFGKGIKQLESVGPNGEIIMDYSVYDALEAGFDKIIFVIRKDIERPFKEIIGNRIEKFCDIEYAYQDMDDLPSGFKRPDGRVKPWGTGHAVLACRDIIKEPFAIINADDYYGKESFFKVHDYLTKLKPRQDKFDMCMAGFRIKNTLSDNGGVTRGICNMSEDNRLIGINETKNIIKYNGSVRAKISDTEFKEISPDSYVSMNMWGVTPDFVDYLKEDFVRFLTETKEGDITSEFLLPIIIDKMLRDNLCDVKVLESGDKWFGVTYKEDKITVSEAFKKLISDGVYSDSIEKNIFKATGKKLH